MFNRYLLYSPTDTFIYQQNGMDLILALEDMAVHDKQALYAAIDSMDELAASIMVAALTSIDAAVRLKNWKAFQGTIETLSQKLGLLN